MHRPTFHPVHVFRADRKPTHGHDYPFHLIPIIVAMSRHGAVSIVRHAPRNLGA